MVFGSSILGRLPTEGKDRIRWTILNLIGQWITTSRINMLSTNRLLIPSFSMFLGAYATWFHAQETTELLMLVMNYVVGAFAEPALSLHAARALRDLCENNRKALSSQIDSFAALYANLHSIPVRYRLRRRRRSQLMAYLSLGFGENKGAASYM